MNIFTHRSILAALLGLVLAPASTVHAGTTINTPNSYAYGANIGWIDWRGDGAHGAVIGTSFCSGYIYGADVGWINLGGGTPLNGIQYQNNSATDFGVNLDGTGKLSGYAYGANIGWIAFTPAGSPAVDLSSGKFSGYGYSANCGWISLSNAFAFVQTTGNPANPSTFKITTLIRQPNGTINLTGTGFANTQYTVLVKTNGLLSSWISNGVITATSLGVIQYSDASTGATKFRERYYTLRFP
jgi:hypothetical protein